MKPAPAPKVPGTAPWARLDSAVRMVLSVPKETILKSEARLKRSRAAKKRKTSEDEMSKRNSGR